MAIIKVDLTQIRVTDPEAEASFTTYLRYLQHLEAFLGGEYGIGRTLSESLSQTMGAIPAVQKIQRRKLSPEQTEDLHKALRVAWHRESRLRALLDRPPQDLSELLPGCGNDAYYAMNAAAQALFIASGQGKIRDHASVLSTLGNFVVQRRLFIQPWSVACDGVPSLQAARWTGIPQGVVLGPIHNWASPTRDTLWNGIAKILLTTRDRELRARKEEWRAKNGKKRTPPAKSLEIATKMPATTLFHFLWRLRKRDDYGDVDIFIEGVPLDEHAKAFLDALLTVVYGTLACFETLIARYSHKAELEAAASRMASKTKYSAGARERVLDEKPAEADVPF